MPASRRVTPYLQRRLDVWYFRFQLPTRLRPFASRTEICVSLRTAEVSVARERATLALPHVYSLKRLCKLTMELTADEVRRVVQTATLRMIDAIERSREPVNVGDSESSPGMNEIVLASSAFGFQPQLNPDAMYSLRTSSIGAALQRGEHGEGAALAKHMLATTGIVATEDSELFHQLSLQMLKLQLSLRQIADARSRGDRASEFQILDYYRRQTLSLTDSRDSTQSTIKVPMARAWTEYATEKKDAKPKPDWSKRTADFQEATFTEFREIVGDISVGEVTRDAMLRYRNDIARLPANRLKRYPGKTAAELLDIEIPADQLPSSRTVHEKLVRIGAFLKWCRDTKGYLPLILWPASMSASIAKVMRRSLEPT